MCMRGVTVEQLLPLERQLLRLLTQKGSKQMGRKQTEEEETQRGFSEEIPVPAQSTGDLDTDAQDKRGKNLVRKNVSQVESGLGTDLCDDTNGNMFRLQIVSVQGQTDGGDKTVCNCSHNLLLHFVSNSVRHYFVTAGLKQQN